MKTWQKLTTDQRLVFHKLLSREFRVGVSATLLIRALAEVAGVDPQMQKAPPEGGAMKVIPPPGSPGGNPSIQPK